MTKKLKPWPCPFCGSKKTSYIQYPGQGVHFGCYRGIVGNKNGTTTDEDCTASIYINSGDVNVAIKKWNTRAEVKDEN